MSLRRALAAVLPLPDGFRDRALALCDRHDLPEAGRRLRETSPATAPLPVDPADARTRRLVWRLWVFDAAPVGATLAGPAYRDNPVVYATRTVRDLTGYDLAALRGENLRRLQGPETEAGAVAALREAIAAWSEATVELTNYRRDGTAFVNRVTVVPVEGRDGTVTHWIGLQRAVDGA